MFQNYIKVDLKSLFHLKKHFTQFSKKYKFSWDYPIIFQNFSKLYQSRFKIFISFEKAFHSIFEKI